MCGRYYIAQEDNDEEIARIIAILNKDAAQAAQIHRGEIFPFQMAPVIAMASGGWTVKPMQWGFPRPEGKGLVINSRSEKADVTPMFRRAVQEGRCLVPMTGFYEWRRETDGRKTGEKFAFSLADGHAMFLAGVYTPSENGPDRFAVLTQEADDQMRPFHHRMPVILDSRQARHRWLFSPPAVSYRDLKKMFAAPELIIRQAGAAVQNHTL